MIQEMFLDYKFKTYHVDISSDLSCVPCLITLAVITQHIAETC